ncbi:Hint domain-containing protein [uncultured Tateyamaria sp.]|uniref:Hint domain-containing protein n=1 Tax=Tateyamaria sp. 1078 TaxID=3417464 RepID=UPI00261B92D2|nr:Hint domain-containing protein [uncultured Tateyamaria sp.]
MTWIGLTDHLGGRFSPTGLGRGKLLRPGKLLERGTVMVETFIAGELRPHDLLSVAQHYPAQREFAFRAVPGGGFALVHHQAGNLTHAAVSWSGDGRPHTLRLSYSWDTRLQWGRLTLEQPERTLVRSSTVPNPSPILTEDIRDLMLGHADRKLSKEVLFSAATSGIVPVGPLPSLHPSTPIATPTGYRDAGTLRRGDVVITDRGETSTVLHTVRYSVPARGSFAPVRLHAPYFGLQRDIVVAPEQRLVLRGSEVEYIFGQEAVLVPARHLVNGYAASWRPTQSVAEYVQVILPRHEALLAAGTAVESLYIGRIRRKPELLAASVLAGVPDRELPEHGAPVHQVLRSFEAITLIENRAA